MFRLTVALVAGICLADLFPSENAVWLCVVAACLSFTGVWLYFSHRYASRWMFGVCACFAFAALGGALLQMAKQRVHADWPTSDALYVGTLQTFPQKHRNTYLVTLHVEARKDTASQAWKEVEKDILLYYMPDSTRLSLRCGDKVCFYGKVGLPPNDVAVTGFDYGRYLECQGISGTAVAFSGRWKKVGRVEGFSLRGKALEARRQVLAEYRSWNLDADAQAVLSALTVGDKSELTHELKATYSAAGASHVLALSGLHVGLLSLILSWMLFPLRWLRGGRWIIGLCSVSLLWGFAILTGLSPSVVRAVTMFSLYVLASVWSDSRFSGGYALALAAFCMLVYQPLYLFDVGFQLSFSAVLGILLFAPVVERIWNPRRAVWRYVWKSLTVSFAAQMGTAPLVLHYFGTFPTYFLLSNLFVAPLAMLVFALALVALAVVNVPLVCGWAVSALAGTLGVLNGLMEGVCGLQGAQITSVYYDGWQSLLLMVGMLALLGYVSARSVRSLIVALLACNLLVGSFVYGHLHPLPSELCFVRGGICIKQGRNLTQVSASHGLCRVEGRVVALLNDGSWQEKQADMPLEVDYAYVCRGFRGSVTDIHRLFRARCVLLDASLGDAYREWLVRQCRETGQSYLDLSDKGFHSILL